MSNWKTTTLGEEKLFQYLNGLWKGKKPPFQQSVVIRNTNFRNDGILDLSDVAILDVESRQLEKRKLNIGDIIIERSGGGPKQAVGRVCYFDTNGPLPFSFSNFTTVLRIKDTGILLPKFVHYYLLYLYQSGFTIPLQRATTGIRNLDFDAYLNAEIPIPSKSEQQKVTAMLGKIQQAIRIEEKFITLARELKKSTMQQLFTHGLRAEAQKESDVGLIARNWNVHQFNELREFLQYGTSTKCGYEKIGNPVIRIPNIFDGQVSAEDLKWCNLNKKEVESWRLQDGDILFIRTNGVRERVGTCAVYRGQPEQALFASYLIRARLKTDLLNPDFFQYYISTAMGTSFLGGRASPAADGKFNINTKTIDSVLLPLPELKEQEEIVIILQKIDQRISLHERKKTTLQQLFQSLLHKLMTGEIRVNDLDIDVSQVTNHFPDASKMVNSISALK